MMDFLSQTTFLQRYNRDGSGSGSELLKRDTIGTPCIFRRLFPASSLLCSAPPELEIPDQEQIHRHLHPRHVCTKAHKYRNTIKTGFSQAVWRKLTCGILPPSAPHRHDQWHRRRTSAAPWLQSVRREDRLGKTTRGDGPPVDGHSPSGWDEVHQRGEWTRRQQTARPSAALLAAGVFSCCYLLVSACWCLCTGEGLFGEGEGEDVRTVWRNAAVDAEAFTGNQGKERHTSTLLPVKLCGKLWISVKMQSTVCVCRRPPVIGGVWSQRWKPGRRPWMPTTRWTALS